MMQMENSKIAKWRSLFEQGEINVGDTLHYKQMTKQDGTSKKLEVPPCPAVLLVFAPLLLLRFAS
eukprot:27811-Hanusia_phi.AAC.1